METPPSPATAGPKLKPEEAVRAELRALLYDLADSLLDHADRAQLQDAIRHAWVLADLADMEEGLVRMVLRNLARDLQGSEDRAHYARQIQNAMDRLS